MAEDDRGESVRNRHRGSDPDDSDFRGERNTSAWGDPRFWVSVLGVLLTIMIAVGGFLASELFSIHNTLNTILVSNSADSAKKTQQIEQLQRDVSKMDQRLTTDETNQNAYNYNLKADLVKIQAHDEQRSK